MHFCANIQLFAFCTPQVQAKNDTAAAQQTPWVVTMGQGGTMM